MDSEIKKSILSFPVFFERINDEIVSDERFTKVKIFLMHTGLNYNKGIFEKEVVDAALPSLEYIPIVGFIDENKLGGADFTGHKYILVKDINGVRRKYIGHAYGVVLSASDNDAHYEMRVCDDGIEREFLVVTGIVWNMFEDSIDIMLRDMVKNHSMELYPPSVKGYEDENGIFHYESFSFRAACILGDEVESAMFNSTIEVDFSISDFVTDMQSELNDRFNAFSKIIDEKKAEKITKGGKDDMAKTDFAQTVMQQFNDICSIVEKQELMKDRWGDAVSRYYAVDVQDDEVIVVDKQDSYRYYGIPFTVDGDKVSLDFANAKRKKVVYEDYVEGEAALDNAFDFGKHIEEIEKAAFEKVTSANEKMTEAENEKETALTNYSQIKKDYDEIKPKYDEFVKAEEDAKAQEISDQKDSMLAQFEKDLSDNSDFVALKEDKDNLTLEDIEQKCSVLFTRKMREQNNTENKTDFSKESGIVGVMDDSDDGNDTYVPTKYGNIPVKR